MKTKTRIAIIAALVGGAGLITAFAKEEAETDKQPATQSAEGPKSVAAVQTALVRAGEISQVITAYGTASAEPGATAAFSFPIEGRVRHVKVAAGQAVKKETVLLEIEPSPDARQQFMEARIALDATSKDLQQTQQRFGLKLATNQDLQQSQQAVDVAKMHLDNLQQRGAGGEVHEIKAESSGVVSKVDVQEGQIVAAGGPLIEVVSRNQIEIKLGVEPSDVSLLRVDQPVRLFEVNTRAGIDQGRAAKVRLIGQRVNPDTRLVDVFAAPESSDGLLLDSFFRGELSTAASQGVIVPREAVLPDEEGMLLFTVKDGHAVKHVVKVGISNDKDAQIIGDDLKAGDVVVVVGNYELEDGMAVSTEPAK